MTTPTMHKEFATWYSRVDLDDVAERLHARWAGVSTLAENVEYEHCEYLLDIFMEKPGATTHTQSDFMRKAFVAADPTFPPSDNEAEMALLAEIILAVLLDTSEYDPLVGYIANLIYSALHGGGVEVNSATDILSRATDAMRFQGNVARKRKPLPKAPEIYTPTIEIDDCFEDDFDPGDLETTKIMLQKIVTKAASTMGTLAKQARGEREVLESDTPRPRRRTGPPLVGVERPERNNGKAIFLNGSKGEGTHRCLRSRAILLSSSRVLLLSAGLLEKAGLKASKKVSISEAVNACDEAWLA